jgi:hypothetical protein
MAADLTDHVWIIKELLTAVPLPRSTNTLWGDHLNSVVSPKSVGKLTVPLDERASEEHGRKYQYWNERPSNPETRRNI